jgi:streptomycin 6-kinase
VSLLPFDLPSAVTARAGADDRWAAWVDGLPRVVRGLLDEWELGVDGPPLAGTRALVVPVRAAGHPVVLKVSGPDSDEHEALALQLWQGGGAVRLVRGHPRRRAVLLERAGPGDATALDDVAAAAAVAGLYARLHVPAPASLPSLRAHVARLADELAALPRGTPVPHRVVDQAAHLARRFAADPATDGVAVHGDLHPGHLLAAEREPWLAVAPRPWSGDPHAEVTPLLHHGWADVAAAGDVRSAVRQRFHTVVDAAGLDENRARDWVVVREVERAVRAVRDGDATAVTSAVSVIKAVQD